LKSTGLIMLRENVLGVVGWKNSGKTTLVEALVHELTRRGFRISTIKHAHHAFDIDVPGKDSYRHREAGAHEVLVASSQRWALMHELRDEEEPQLESLLAQLAPCDLVLVEGFKRNVYPKIEVLQAARPEGRIADTDSTICAIAASDPVLAGDLMYLPLGDTVTIADFVCMHRGLSRR
jgi:molybdopterin-guanine dinucleotide biosynthesis adapter protein